VGQEADDLGALTAAHVPLVGGLAALLGATLTFGGRHPTPAAKLAAG
jgi:hypothetical protein